VPNTPSEFWDFSLRIYALPGVADECLDLQERYGANVNLLLFCAFCGARFGARLSVEELTEASALVKVWHCNVTKSLRMARTSIKQIKLDNAASPTGGYTESLRQSIKQLELEAEHVEHAILSDWWLTKASGVTVSGQADAIKSNIFLLLGESAEAPALVNAALAERK
jgi:uncharacterized protein (TIGR02444 family)